MRRISAYYISLLIITLNLTVSAQDSIKVKLNIRAGIDVLGPINYFTDPDKFNFEGFVAFERNNKKSYVIEAGYQDFKYSQYNYSYFSKGAFIRGGIDINLIQPFLSAGKYYAGIGLRYGLSLYRSEFPSFSHENYWGTGTGSIASSVHLAHFVEVSPGIRTEIFKNVTFGWNLRLRLIVYRGTGKDLRPVSVPGYGNGVKSFSPGFNYYIIFNFPYKSVFVKPESDKVTEPETGSGKK
jgi:hypothetical protein